MGLIRHTCSIKPIIFSSHLSSGLHLFTYAKKFWFDFTDLFIRLHFALRRIYLHSIFLPCPPCFLHNGYRVPFAGVKRSRRSVEPQPHLAQRLSMGRDILLVSPLYIHRNLRRDLYLSIPRVYIPMVILREVSWWCVTRIISKEYENSLF